MFKLTIKDSEYNDLGIEKYFETKDELFKYFVNFINPIENGWLSTFLKDAYDKEFTKENIEEFYREEVFIDSFSMSATIMNGIDNQDKRNFEYEINKIEFTSEYTKPLAWGGYISKAEVFPENYKNIENAFSEWISKINEDCMDSYRIGLLNSEKSMVEYNTFISCCGSKDEDIEVDGIVYRFGCNFGH